MLRRLFVGGNHLRWCFFVSFLLFLLSQKKKQEKPDGKRKKKKGCSRSSRSRELLSKLKIPPLATDCFTPSANPTVPDLLVCLDGGGGRLLADSREGSGDRLWAVVVRSPRALSVAMGACGKNRSLTTRRGVAAIVC